MRNEGELRTMEHHTTLVVGASPEPTRYSHMAATRLMANGHPVVLLGKRKGSIADEPIMDHVPPGTTIHTITMYVAPAQQTGLVEELLALRPARIIFNPGTENSVFAEAALARGIEVVEGCTLVMLATGEF